VYGSVDSSFAHDSLLHHAAKKSRRKKRGRTVSSTASSAGDNSGAEEKQRLISPDADEQRRARSKRRAARRRAREQRILAGELPGSSRSHSRRLAEAGEEPTYLLTHAVGQKLLAEAAASMKLYNVTSFRDLPKEIQLTLNRKLRENASILPRHGRHRLHHPIDADITARRGLSGRFHQGQEVRKERERLHIQHSALKKDNLVGNQGNSAAVAIPQAKTRPHEANSGAGTSVPRRKPSFSGAPMGNSAVIAISSNRENQRTNQQRAAREKLEKSTMEAGELLSKTP
jgi:hypothetical protein